MISQLVELIDGDQYQAGLQVSSRVTHKHEMDNISDTIVREWEVKPQAAKYHWHVYPLDWG
jgi:hypothetical protein